MLSNKSFLFFVIIFLMVNIISVVINVIFIKKNVYKLKFVNDNSFEFIVNDYIQKNSKNKGTIIYKNIDELNSNSMIKLLNDKKICLNSSNNQIKIHFFNFLKLSLPSIDILSELLADSVDINDIYNDPVDKIYRVSLTSNEYNFNISLFSKDKYYNKNYLNDVSEEIKKVILFYYKPKEIDINYNDYINDNYKNLLINIENAIYKNIFSKYNFINPNHELSEKINYLNYQKFFNSIHQVHTNYSKEFFIKYDKYLNKCEREILILLNNLNILPLLNNIEYNNDLEFDKVYNAIKENNFEISNSFEIKIFTLPVIFKFLFFHLLITLLLLYLFRQIWN